MTIETKDIVHQLCALREKRKKFEAAVKLCKEGEEKLSKEILARFAVSGTSGQRFTEDSVMISITTKDHVEIRDKEKMARFVLHRAITSLKSEGSIAEACNLYQMQAKKATVKALLEQGYTAEQMGIELVEDPALSIRTI